MSAKDLFLERSLPSSVDAERSVLGSILLDNRLCNQAMEALRPEDMYLDAHRKIYEKMISLSEQGRPIDPITLGEELKRAGEFDQVGGNSYVTGLIDGIPRLENIEHYAKIVKGKSTLRKLIAASNQIIATCFEQDQDPETIIDLAEKSIFNIAEDRMREGFVDVGTVAHKRLEEIESMSGRAEMITGIPTGFTDLDKMTAGLQRSDLIVIAARPSMGKCLAFDSEIVLESGEVATIEEIYTRRRARLLTLDDGMRFRWTAPSAFVDDGVKPVYRVTTRLGRTIETTITHPFLTLDGWRRLEHVRAGERVAVPRRIRVFGRDALPEREIAAMADAVRDGGVVPAPVFRLPRRQLERFVELVVGDGVFATANERAARQLQHLFLRFGVVAALSCEAGAWRLRVVETSRDAVAREAVARTVRAYAGVAVAASAMTSVAPAPSDVYWDEIVAIEPAGAKQVYDLTIPETHNFVANDVCVHNTSFAMNVAQYAARAGHPVGVFSLEMSSQQLVSRLLCSEAHIDAHRFRTGYLNREEWARLAEGLHRLSESKIYIDDTPGLTTLEMRAKARRLKQEQGLGLLLVDYLQLIQSRGRADSRTNEVSQISRDLKMLAKELDVPLIALSQLSRAPETRTDHRPQLSDLRESGCLAGDTLVTVADTGARIPIRELVGRSDFRVWALNEESMRLESAAVSRAFPTGVKPVFRLETKLGRVIRATANHKFRTIAGWKRLDELAPDDRIALPRQVPCGSQNAFSGAEAALLGHLIGDGCTLPRHAIQYTTHELELAELVVDYATTVFGGLIAPRIKQERSWYQVYLPASFRLTHGRRSPVAAWMDQLGVFGLRSHEKRVPRQMFEQSSQIIGRFLQHLWATDGCVRESSTTTQYPAIYYASSSEQLVRDVQVLLLRLGMNAVLRPVHSKKGRLYFTVRVMGHDDILLFADRVGAVGFRRRRSLAECVHWVGVRGGNTNRAVIPATVWQEVAIPVLAQRGISHRRMQAAMGTNYCGTGLLTQNVSRGRLARLSVAIGGDESLDALANSDIYWDKVVSITPDGETDVYDLTVPGYANFVANEMVVHNSIEQDADVVAFIYREEMYGATDENQGVAELIIGKQRNGPTGTVRLAFLKEFTRFENLWQDNY